MDSSKLSKSFLSATDQYFPQKRTCSFYPSSCISIAGLASFLLFFSLTALCQVTPLSDAVSETWVKRWAGMGGEASSVHLDATGNVYATGAKPGVVKYNSSGEQQWAIKYNANAFRAGALAVDSAGNVYLATTSYNDNASYPNENYVIRKLNASGQQQWMGIYDHAEENDIVRDVAVDEHGNVYVTGISLEYGANGFPFHYDYATVKYDATGAEQWIARYDGGHDMDDYVTDLKVDPAGNVFVTGYSESDEAGIAYATIKYNSLGEELWVERYSSPDNLNSYSRALAVDTQGNVYVTGSSEATSTGADYATIKYNASGALQWVVRYDGGQGMDDEALALKVDVAGNVLVTGTSGTTNGVSCNYPTVWTTLKYDPSGNQQWLAHYGGVGDPAMDIDAGGNVYVTGGVYEDDCTKFDYATVKFSPSGLKLWEIGYQGSDNSNDYASSIVVDSMGNVFVAGDTEATGVHDLATIKYTQQTSAPLIAVDDSYATSQDMALVVDAPGVLSNDIAADTATLMAFLVDDPAHGLLVFNTDGSFVYSPNALFAGADSFTYKASNGTEDSNSATVTLMVGSMSDSLEIHSITAPKIPQKINAQINVSASYSGSQAVAAIWNWGDGSTSPGNVGDSLVTGTHKYASQGLYTISIILVSAQGDSAAQTDRYVAVYDPNRDFVAGLGRFHSPIGAYVDDFSLEGKVDFGFWVQDKEFSDEIFGKMVFKSRSGDIRFVSTIFDSLLISEKTAIIKGEGIFNNHRDFYFQLSVADETNQGGTDKMRVQVWDKQEVLVYDNQIDDPTEAVTTGIQSGAIIVNATNNDQQFLQNFRAYPIPLTGKGLRLRFPELKKESLFRVVITDMRGRKMAEKDFQINEPHGSLQLWDLNNHSWPSGIYILSVTGEGIHHQQKIKK